MSGQYILNASTGNPVWYRVYARWSKAWVYLGLAYDRPGYLAFCDRAHKDRCVETCIYRVELVDGMHQQTRIFAS